MFLKVYEVRAFNKATAQCIGRCREVDQKSMLVYKVEGVKNTCSMWFMNAPRAAFIKDVIKFSGF